MAKFSILLPHKRDPENDKALRIALDCILANTVNDYELLIDTSTPRDPYLAYNLLAEQARCPWIVMTNTDVFFAPGWDTPMLQAAQEDTIVTGVVVEPGCIGCPPVNVRFDFGMRPDTFLRGTFEEYVRIGALPVPPGDGWYMPCLMSRDRFLQSGGFKTALGAFGKEPLDMFYWQEWRAAGRRVQRTTSYCYHLQNYSDAQEQRRTMRHETR